MNRGCIRSLGWRHETRELLNGLISMTWTSLECLVNGQCCAIVGPVAVKPAEYGFLKLNCRLGASSIAELRSRALSRECCGLNLVEERLTSAHIRSFGSVRDEEEIVLNLEREEPSLMSLKAASHWMREFVRLVKPSSAAIDKACLARFTPKELALALSIFRRARGLAPLQGVLAEMNLFKNFRDLIHKGHRVNSIQQTLMTDILCSDFPINLLLPPDAADSTSVQDDCDYLGHTAQPCDDAEFTAFILRLCNQAQASLDAQGSSLETLAPQPLPSFSQAFGQLEVPHWKNVTAPERCATLNSTHCESAIHSPCEQVCSSPCETASCTHFETASGPSREIATTLPCETVSLTVCETASLCLPQHDASAASNKHAVTVLAVDPPRRRPWDEEQVTQPKRVRQMREGKVGEFETKSAGKH